MINYTIDTTVESVCNNTTDTSILLSNFDGHPLDTAIYDYATVTAINDGGRSNDSDSISLLRDGELYIQYSSQLPSQVYTCE